jgi:DNA-damage-inducible protein J
MTTTIKFKIERNKKKAFEKFCNEIGISVSSILNIFINKTLEEKCIPFDVGLKNEVGARTKAILNFDKVCGSMNGSAKLLGINSEEEADK